MTSEDEVSSSESEQGEEMAKKNIDSSDDDSSKEMETVGAVEVELEEKVCIDGEGNGFQDGGSSDSEDDSSSDDKEHITWQAALTGDLDADSAESNDDDDNDWKPGVKRGAKKTKVKEKQKGKRKVDDVSVKKPISQTLVDLMDMDDNNHDDNDDDSGSDEDWAPESTKGRKKGLSDGENDLKIEKLDS